MKDRIMNVAMVFSALICAYVVFLRVEWVHKGGPIMVPMVFCSIFAFAVILAKIRQLSEDRIDVEKFLGDIFEFMERQRIKEAIDLCDRTNRPASRIFKAGIVKYDRPKDEIKEIMDDSFLYEIPLLEDNLLLLSTIVQVLPLLGLLGTIVGLIKVFGVMEAKTLSLVSMTVKDIAPGVWEALISTATGFVLAIPVLMAHNYLKDRVRSFVDELERGASELLGFLMERRISL